MSSEGPGDKEFWDRFEKWEKEWEKQRKAQRLEDAKKLHEAEQEYDRSVHSLNPLAAPVKIESILGTKTSEPGLKRLPLKDPKLCPLVMPAKITQTDQTSEAQALVFFQTEQGEKILEAAAFQVKKLIEYLLDERILFFLKPEAKDSFFIQMAWENKARSFFQITLSSPGVIQIKALKRSFTWSPGYIFDCYEILKLIVQRLNQEQKA